MSDPQVRLFDRCTPIVGAGGTIDVGVSQTLNDGSERLSATGTSTVKLVVEGPRLRLSPQDVAGVYPAPGSEESPDEFLPHVALKRRTLPWERPGPNSTQANPVPWLALLVLKESELAYTIGKANTPGAVVHASTLDAVKTIDAAAHAALVASPDPFPTTAVADWVYLTNAQIPRLLPLQKELALLCHVKRVSTTTNGKTDDVDHAIVIANRLPDAGPEGAAAPAERHVALLVSLEKRKDVYVNRSGTPNGRLALLVLHHWTFTPSKGGDFEQVMQAIRYRPNGGVLRFGSLAAALPTPQTPSLSGGFPALVSPNGALLDPIAHEQRAQDVVYRGPLRPFDPPARTDGFAVRAAPEEYAGAELPNGTPDFTYAAAFELGRLLALADTGLLEDLSDIHPLFPVIEPPIAESELPPALQKPDWVSNPAWVEQPWEISAGNPILEQGGVILQHGEIDVGGIAEHMGQWDLEGTLGGLSTPAMPAVTMIDVGAVTPASLGIQFAAVQAAAQS